MTLIRTGGLHEIKNSGMTGRIHRNFVALLSSIESEERDCGKISQRTEKETKIVEKKDKKEHEEGNLNHFMSLIFILNIKIKEKFVPWYVLSN